MKEKLKKQVRKTFSSPFIKYQYQLKLLTLRFFHFSRQFFQIKLNTDQVEKV
jgi:hypothetical protein